MNKPKKILQILVKNTSTLDFTLPLFYSLTRRESSQITVLVWYWNMENFFRESNGYLEILHSLGIEVVCLNDFCSPWLKGILLKVSNKSDRRSKKELRFFSYKSFFSSIQSVAIWGLESLVEKIASKYIDPQTIIDFYQPEIVFYDVRKDNDFTLSKCLKKTLIKGTWKVLYAPHAPHMRSPEGDYCDFDDVIPLPKNVICLYSNNKAKPWLANLEKKHQFLNVGYPGFNEAWGEFLESSRTLKPTGPYRILYIGRRFLAPEIDNDEFDIYTMTYSETVSHLEDIKKAADIIFGDNYEVIIKPHPNVNATLVKQLVLEANLKNYTISYGSAFSFVGNVELVLSEPSTVALIFGYFKVRTLLFQSRLQSVLEENWDELSYLYSGFPRIRSHADIIKHCRDTSFEVNQDICRKRITDQYSTVNTERFIGFLEGKNEYI